MTSAGSRDRAAEVVDAMTAKLTDPAHVVAAADDPGNVIITPRVTRSPWSPISLSDGYPAVALLFAELAMIDPGRYQLVHDYLSAGLAAGVSAPHTGLYLGPSSLAFAAHAAAVGSGSYTTLLSRLDKAIAASVRRRALVERGRIADGAPIGSWSYDVISGISGTGRYLLSRYEGSGNPAIAEALAEVLVTVVAIAVADDVVVDGKRAPAWWVHLPVGPSPVLGHLNLGFAHGVCGPLALLALAWRAGVRVERHDEAIDRIVSLLGRWQVTDDAGPYWPYYVSIDRIGAPGLAVAEPRVRDAWCYGTAGLARALYLAGVATGNDGWRDEAHRALRAVLATEGGGINDFSLCHGWAGLLQITSRMAHDSKKAEYRAAADAITTRIINGFDNDKPFGYHYPYLGATVGVNRPGFIQGAAGIALALHCHATGRTPATNWDAAMLLN